MQKNVNHPPRDLNAKNCIKAPSAYCIDIIVRISAKYFRLVRSVSLVAPIDKIKLLIDKNKMLTVSTAEIQN